MKVFEQMAICKHLVNIWTMTPVLESNHSINVNPKFTSSLLKAHQAKKVP